MNSRMIYSGISIGALFDYYLVRGAAPVKEDRGGKGSCFLPLLKAAILPYLGFWPCQNRVVPYGHVRNRKAPVAQLDRATVYGTVGWRFEPVRVQDSE